jgi:multiple sugar transport system substrate-binding protein
MFAGVLLAFGASEALVKNPVAPGPVHITYWEKWTGFEGEAMRKVVNDFNSRQNKIFVDLLTVSNIQDKTMLAISAGIPPDVAGLYGPNLAQYVDDRAIVPLDEFCKETGISGKDYKPAFFKIGYYHDHIYSLPTTPATTALHYNTELMSKAGLDPGKPPKTVEELAAMADKVTKKDAKGHIEVAGFLPAEPGWWNWCWGYFFGGKLMDGDRITPDSPENVRAFEWVQSFPKKYGAIETQTFKSGFGNFDSPQNAFMTQKDCFELQGVWMYNFITKYAPDMKWGAVAFPYPKDRPELANTTIADEDIIVIPRGSKHPKEAFEFIKFVESQHGMEELCLGQKKFSPLISVSPDFYRKHPNPFVKLFDDLASSPNVCATPQTGIWTEYSQELNNAFDEIGLLKESPKEALAKVRERMQPRYDQYMRRLKLREQVEGGS